MRFQTSSRKILKSCICFRTRVKIENPTTFDRNKNPTPAKSIKVKFAQKRNANKVKILKRKMLDKKKIYEEKNPAEKKTRRKKNPPQKITLKEKVPATNFDASLPSQKLLHFVGEIENFSMNYRKTSRFGAKLWNSGSL